jgi:hypothetical protein
MNTKSLYLVSSLVTFCVFSNTKSSASVCTKTPGILSRPDFLARNSSTDVQTTKDGTTTTKVLKYIITRFMVLYSSFIITYCKKSVGKFFLSKGISFHIHTPHFISSCDDIPVAFVHCVESVDFGAPFCYFSPFLFGCTWVSIQSYYCAYLWQ